MLIARHFKHSLLLLFYVVAGYCVSAQCEQSAVECPQDCSAAECCFSMYEGVGVGEVVGNVNVVTAISQTLMSDVDDGINLQGESDYFLLNTTTGEVQIKEDVDREVLGVPCLTFGVQVTNADDEQSLFIVGVVVQDINDNSPEFTVTSYSIERREEMDLEVCVGHTPQLEASDADIGSNGQITYSLADGGAASMFIISEENCITNTTRLDRDVVPDSSITRVNPLYLTLIATDGGNPPRQSNITFTINLSDINDNPPKFTTESLETITILENETDGTVIRDLNATDRDYNNELTYTLVSRNVPFLLNTTSGQLSVAVGNSRLNVNGYNLSIQVSDSELSSTSTLHIVVQDVNDRATISPLGNVNYVFEEESTDFTIRYQIQDPEAASLDNFTVELSGVYSENFLAVISQHSLLGVPQIAITLTRKIDQEALIRDTGNTTIRLIIEVTEIGVPNITHRIFTNITVTGTNDNLPFLNRTEFEFEEEQPPGSRVAQLLGQDLDAGKDGVVVSYCIESAVAYPSPQSTEAHPQDLTSLFIMSNDLPDPSNRTLTAPMLDRENGIETVIVTMNLTDGGGSSNLVNITIHVKDVNDNYPVFPEKGYKFSFQEGRARGPISSVEAMDVDNGTNAVVEYKLLDYQHLFSVNKTTGEVSTLEVFDREEREVYTIKIKAMNVTAMAKNTDTNDLRNVVTVVLTVDDVNDSPPVWENSLDTFTISSDSPVKTLVVSLTATDADLEENAAITYKLEPSRLFDITPDNGIIKVATDLTNETGSHNLLVIACDQQHSTPRNITIEVKEPESTTSSSILIIGSISGVCVLLLLFVVAMVIVLLYVFLDKRKRSVNFSKSRSETDDTGSPTPGILRPIPSSSVSYASRSSCSNSNSRGVKFHDKVKKIGYDYEHAVNNSSDVYFTESSIHLDSSGDESPVMPPRLPTTSSHHHNGKLLSDRHSHMLNGAPRLPPIQENFLYSHAMHHPIQDDTYYDEDSEGNSDDDSTLPDNASSTNATLPSVRHLSHIASSPNSSPSSTRLGPLPPMAQIPPSHQFVRSPEHGVGYAPRHHDELSIHSSSSDSLTPPPVHSHISHENQRINRQSSRGTYPVHMPEGYIVPPSSAVAARYSAGSFMDHFDGTDFEDTSTYASAELDEVLHFRPDQEPGIFSLTPRSSYYEESQL